MDILIHLTTVHPKLLVYVWCIFTNILTQNTMLVVSLFINGVNLFCMFTDDNINLVLRD